MENSGVGLGDLLAVMNSRNGSGDFMGGNSIWVIFLFFIFAIFFSGGNGWFGNRGGSDATQGDVQRGFDQNMTIGKLDGITQGICNLGYENARIGGQIDNVVSTIGARMQQCCCDTQKEILESRYQSERNTCDIVNAIHADGEATRGLITQNTIQQLRDELQAAQLQLGNVAQTQTLMNQLKPFPVPAYITCSPYAANSSNYCGNSCCMG